MPERNIVRHRCGAQWAENSYGRKKLKPKFKSQILDIVL